MILATHTDDPAALVEILHSYGDLVEASDAAYVKVGELPAASELAQHLHAATGLPVGLARGKFPARMAALHTGNVLAVLPGKESEFLKPLPVGLLPLNKELERQFWLLGIRTLGDFARLPVDGVLTRFGKGGRALQRLAQGRDIRPLVPHIPEQREWLTFHLDDPINDWRVLGGIMDWLLDQLAGKVGSLATRELCLVAGLENGESVSISVTLSTPTSDATYIRRRFAGLLMSLQTARSVVSLRVELGGLRSPDALQVDMFVRQHALDDTLDDLIAKYGEKFWRVAEVYEKEHLPERRWRLEVA